jgi:selenocysteine lyase/cysteine desulfurase
MLKCQRDKFMLSRKVAYLNCAYMSPMMKKVENAGRKGIAAKRKPYKVAPEDFFSDSEALRDHFAKLIDTDSPERNVLIPSVSYGMANVASNLPKKKGKVLVAEDQFPSNKYPWDAYDVEVVERPDDQNQSWTETFLDRSSPKVSAVCFSHVHWVDGALFDLKAIREKTRQTETALVIDATQSLGALPFSVKEIDPDALVVAGYKWLFGPYGLGMAYYGEMFDTGTPIEHNWINRKNSEDFGGLVNYTDEFQPGSLRYEVGEHSNFILVPMLLAAVKQINKWGPANIQQYIDELSKEGIAELMGLGYKIEPRAKRAGHLFGIRFREGMNPDKIKSSLAKNRVNVSFRGDAIRVAPQVYNDKKDMNRLVRALKEAL